jgi:hypothetical protein
METLLAGPGPLAPPACEAPLSPPVEEPGPSRPAPSVITPTPTVPRATAPSTRILKHPRRLLRSRSNTARVGFRFGSDQTGATFLCKIDKGIFHSCGARIFRRFGVGPHVVTVKAVGSAGIADPSPAVFRFRVEHIF